MKRLIAVAFAALLFSSNVSAQANIPGVPNDGLVGALLGDGGVVPSLFSSLTEPGAGPLIGSLAGSNGDSGLLQGSGPASLNQVLISLLAPPFNSPEGSANGLAGFLITGPNGGLLGGLGNALIGQSDLAGGFGGGALFGGAMVPGGGQGLSADAIPLEGVDPGTQAALANGVTLPGL